MGCVDSGRGSRTVKFHPVPVGQRPRFSQGTDAGWGVCGPVRGCYINMCRFSERLHFLHIQGRRTVLLIRARALFHLPEAHVEHWGILWVQPALLINGIYCYDVAEQPNNNHVVNYLEKTKSRCCFSELGMFSLKIFIGKKFHVWSKRSNLIF